MGGASCHCTFGRLFIIFIMVGQVGASISHPRTAQFLFCFCLIGDFSFSACLNLGLDEMRPPPVVGESGTSPMPQAFSEGLLYGAARVLDTPCTAVLGVRC